ncbi:MAG: DUF1566 domain-containing protein [Acidobacteriota bacterium]
MKNAFTLSLLALCLSAHAGAQSATTPPAKQPAPAASTWTDPATGLMWAARDNGSDVNWNQAKEYCSKLRLAGDRDWRLPPSTS